MLPEKIIYIGVLINLFGTIWYIKNILYGGTRPNLVSSFIWVLAPAVAIFLQLRAGAGISFIGTFLAGFGPLLIIIFSLIKRNAFWKINTFDVICGLFSILALVLYIITNKLGISIFFAVLSDGLAAVPTIRKSWEFPETESGIMYAGGIISNVLVLLIIKDWSFPIYAFSAYLIVVNTIIVFAIYRRKIIRKK